MKCYQFTPSEDKYTLELCTRPDPVPGAGEVIVAVRAASLNYRDLIHLNNLAKRNVGGVIPLSDGAGEVVAVGQGVTRVKVGDRVAGCFFQKWISGRFQMGYHDHALGGSADGMLTEFAKLDAEGVVKIPDSLTNEQAACLPCAAVTAWHALVERGQLQAGDRVLTMGTGGVSIFGLQFARVFGADVYATTSSEAKRTRLQQLGAKHTFNYRDNPNWPKELWDATDKRGIDHVLEIGGPATLGEALTVVAPGGQIALIGVLTGFGPPKESLFPLVARNANLGGIYVGSRVMFETMLEFMATHQIEPTIDRVFPFSRAAEAFKYLESGNHFGKVVIQVR